MITNVLKIKYSRRELSKNRLTSFKKLYGVELKKNTLLQVSNNKFWFDKLASNAGYKISGKRLCCVCMLFSLFGFFIGLLFNFYASLFLSLLLFYLPVSVAQSRSKQRSKNFILEYPAILLSMSSNMKAGLAVYSSLERSVMLLSEKSDVRREVKTFLEKISRGVPQEVAVSQFGQSINLPELDLFRRAFSLVITHGGRFSSTLERLAKVCRDRENLIKSSQVSTASMRMTSNVLLVVAPVLLFMLSAKNKDFWKVLVNNPTAYAIGLSGFLIIVASVFVLRRMSDFKP